MATDLNIMLKNLFAFYNFHNQTVISVGAGGGQFIEYGRFSKRVIAIDNDQDALNRLDQSLRKANLTDKFTLVHSDFYRVNLTGDVVMFEFCLHEMKDPEAAISHAQTMAPAVLINDHWPESPWAWIVDETEKVAISWKAIHRFGIKKIQKFDAVQFFRDYDELFQKVNVQGESSINRISQYKGKTNFTIPMSYGFVLI